MRLYLSSNGLGSDPSFLRAAASGARALVVLNALDGFDGSRRGALALEAADLARLGYEVDELDLRSTVTHPDRLASRLGDAQLVWVAGGNTFVLARAMAASGFAAAVHGPLVSGALVYAGYSAGAVVAGPDLAGIECMDDPDLVPDGYDAAVLPQALGLVAERIIPHFRSGHAESARAERAAAALTAGGLAHRRLRDGEALLVDAGGARLVGWPTASGADR